MKVFLLAAAFSLFAGQAMSADNPCKELKGPERAACERADKARSEEMRGRGVQGKGQGVENGKGIAKNAREDMGEKAKDKAKDKVKDKVAKSKD
jgi:hypothetical protein